MGLTFLAFFWFAGVAVAVALCVRLTGRHGTMYGFAIAAVCLIALQMLYVTAQTACPAETCGSLGALLDRIRLTLGSLTIAGLAVGFWLARRVLPAD